MPSVRRESIIYTAILYLTRRQLQRRPTTLRQLSKRIGAGAYEILGIFEKYHVEYTLIAHGKPGVVSSTEIVLKTMPEKLVERVNIPIDQLEHSYREVLTESEEAASLTQKDPAITMEQLLSIAEEVDPYSPHRISEAHFQVLRAELIGFEQLVREAKKQGYSRSAIWRATGGDRMTYKIPGPLWRPFVFKGKRYFLREVLNYLEQSDLTYKNPLTAELKRRKRRERNGLPKFIEFEKPSLRRKKRETKKVITQEFLTQSQ